TPAPPLPPCHLSPSSLSLVSPSPRRRCLRRTIPACSGEPRQRAAQIRAPCLRSSLPSGQMRLSWPRELSHDPFRWLGFRGWHPLQLRRGDSDSAPPSPKPTASPMGGSASWMVLLHPVAAGRTRAAGKLRRGGGSLWRLPPWHDGGALHRLKHHHG
uniref:Uncharacterized protein n=1 Tax=Triticum urartu TaxID=4572 RepID=A0A8R7TR28_TRIUA